MAAKDDTAKNSDGKDGMGDLSQAAVKKMIATARERGYITYDELNDVMPPDTVSSEQIEDVMSMLSEMGIQVTEEDEERRRQDKGTDLCGGDEQRSRSCHGLRKLDRTDDPVRMYLREMGSSNCCRAKAKSPLPNASRQVAIR